MSSRRRFLPRARWILLLATVFLLWTWRPLLVFAAVCSDRVRHLILSIDGATGIKSDIAMHASGVSPEMRYPMVGECYVSLRRDYEEGAAPPNQPNAAKAFHIAFCYFRDWQWRTLDHEAENTRFESIYLKTFGSFSATKVE